jgi:thymidylate synthase
MEMLNIHATTIPDAWFRLLYEIFDKTYIQQIERGSFEGQFRYQYAGVSIIIDHPELDMVPVMPEGLGIDPPTTKENIEDYFLNYLISDVLLPNEEYTYGNRINQSLVKVATMLKKTPNTNQAIIEVGQPSDVELNNPPCLRLIDLKVVNDKLVMSVFFRSWDLYSAFCTNLGGLELLKQYISQEIGKENGPLIAYSSGLHLYSMYEKVARLRLYKE